MMKKFHLPDDRPAPPTTSIEVVPLVPLGATLIEQFKGPNGIDAYGSDVPTMPSHTTLRHLMSRCALVN